MSTIQVLCHIVIAFVWYDGMVHFLFVAADARLLVLFLFVFVVN